MRPLGTQLGHRDHPYGVPLPLVPLFRFNHEPFESGKSPLQWELGQPSCGMLAAFRPESLILTSEQCSSQIFPVHNPQAPRRSRAQDPSLGDPGGSPP